MIIDDGRPSLLAIEEGMKESPFLQRTEICTQVYDPTFTLARLHLHEVIEVSIVTAGTGFHCIWDEATACGKGDVYILNAGVPHEFFARSSTERPTVCTLFFDAAQLFDGELGQPDSPRFCYGVFFENPLVAHTRLDGSSWDFVKDVFEQTRQEAEGRRAEWLDAVRAHLMLLLISMNRLADETPSPMENVRATERSLVAEVMRYVIDHHAENTLTLDEVAARHFVSKSYLSRIFYRVVGEHFGDYLRNVRLKQASDLLVQTPMTVKEIVETCGFKDVPSFYRSFARQFALTPNEYRVKIQSEHLRGEHIMSILQDISENLQRGKAKVVKELVQQAIDEGVSVEQILNDGLLAGMSIVGEKFKNNEVYVPEVLVAARAMNMGAQMLKPLMQEAGVQAAGKVCIGTVQGDLHDIGKNLVKMMMEGKGLEVLDLGTDVAPETFVQTAIEQNCSVICCSALLTTTMGVMEDVVKKAEEAGIRNRVKIMVGGAPVTQAFCDKIGADAYTSDAASAADAALAFCTC